jgi:hypothetical protein
VLEVTKPDTAVESLSNTVKGGQTTASQVNAFDQADTPGEMPSHVEVKKTPEVDVYPLEHLITCVVKVEPGTEIESLFNTVSKGQATSSHVSTFDQADTPGRVPEQVAVKVTPALEE